LIFSTALFDQNGQNILSEGMIFTGKRNYQKLASDKIGGILNNIKQSSSSLILKSTLTIMQFRVKLNLVSQLVLPLPSCQM
jgi:hypothetical protein